MPLRVCHAQYALYPSYIHPHDGPQPHRRKLETSILLAIAPHRVDMSRAKTWADRPLSGRLSRDDPASPGYSPSGIYGDPTRASAREGQQLLDAMLEDVLAVFPADALT